MFVMRMFVVSVWMEGVRDGAEPTYTYTRLSVQPWKTVHKRLTNEAMKKFHGWGRIEVNERDSWTAVYKEESNHEHF
jgi:hypothetical protein